MNSETLPKVPIFDLNMDLVANQTKVSINNIFIAALHVLKLL